MCNLNASGNFAYHALACRLSGCDLTPMKIMLRRFRQRLGLTLEQMAERSGFSISQLSRWEGGSSNIPSERFPDLAVAYGCSVSDILQDGASIASPIGPQIVVRGKVAAGEWLDAWEVDPADAISFTGRADAPVPHSQRFGVEVVGESMNMIYPPGTLLDCAWFLSDMLIESGRRVIVQRRRLDGNVECTVKEYFLDQHGAEWLVPRSYNPSFQTPLQIGQDERDIEAVEIIGIVIGSYRPE